MIVLGGDDLALNPARLAVDGERLLGECTLCVDADLAARPEAANP